MAEQKVVYKLVPMKPLYGPVDWIVKINVYYSVSEKEFRSVRADIEVLDDLGGKGKETDMVRVVEIGELGSIVHLPYQRHDRTVQFSVVKVWLPGSTEAINPDLHSQSNFLPGRPYKYLNRVEPRPDRGMWANFLAALKGRWD